VDLSSLVFVAIIGVWAAYLVPHWLSRRDDLSQSRTTDRFSGGLRVLQRRPRKPRAGADHRSGDAVLTSPRVVLDADGEYLYIPADRALAARAERRAADAAAAGSTESIDAESAVAEPAQSAVAHSAAARSAAAHAVGQPVWGSAVESTGTRSATGWPGPTVSESSGAVRADAESSYVEHADVQPGYVEQADVESGYVEQADVESGYVERADVEPSYAERADVERAGVEPGHAGQADAESGYAEQPAAKQVEAARVGDERAEVETVHPESADDWRADYWRANAERISGERISGERVSGESSGAALAAGKRLDRSRATDRLLPDSSVVADAPPIVVPERTPVEIAASDPSSDPPWSAFVPSAPSSLEAPASAPSVPAANPPEVEIPERPFDLEVAIGIARIAARRRARIMALLFIATVVSWVVTSTSSMSAWVAVPATVLLVMHVLASRVAGLRSREALMLLAVQVQSAALVQARPQRSFAAPSRSAEVVAEAAPAGSEERAARRAAAVGAETWEPVPVPPPTYTLKPAVHRPEPAPLDVPAAAATAEAPGAVSRGALPRRAADVERILALESDLDDLFEEPKVVNG
jgi:hypothetical protein